MKSGTRIAAYAALAAVVVGSSSVAALAAKGKDFPGTTCTCQGCAPGGGDTTGDCASVCKDKTVYSKGSEPHDYCKAKELTVNGNNLRAALALIKLSNTALARSANVSPAVITRLQATGRKAMSADQATVDKVIKGLELNGVRITEDGVSLIQKPLP
jgi:hypothetical protein